MLNLYLRVRKNCLIYNATLENNLWNRGLFYIESKFRHSDVNDQAMRLYLFLQILMPKVKY